MRRKQAAAAPQVQEVHHEEVYVQRSAGRRWVPAGHRWRESVTSAPAKKAYVQGIACGLRAKNCYQDMVEQAKAEVDDMVAEATYLTSKPKAEAAAETEAAAE